MSGKRGLDDRERDGNGQIRRKNGNTLVRTLREEYGPDFALGVRSDMKLETLLEEAGAESLLEFLRKRSQYWHRRDQRGGPQSTAECA